MASAADRAFERDPSVGAAVPLFLHPDGRVQEAGSAVDARAERSAIGDGDDPGAFEHRFPRSIDYGSAACLLVRADLFAEVGGFDPIYSPAYYEDADFCFKLTERGFRTVFEPRSRVVHLRGGGSQQAQTLMTANRRIFAERWENRLETRRPLRAESGTADPAGRPRRRGARAHPRDRRSRAALRPGSGDPRMAKLVAELAALWPDARITFFAAVPTAQSGMRRRSSTWASRSTTPIEQFDRWFTRGATTTPSSS